MARRASIAAVVAAAVLPGLAQASLPSSALSAAQWIAWQAPSGAMAVDFASGTAYAVVGAAFFDRAAGKPRGRLVLVDARSAREIWAAEYRNSNCCGTPAIGFLPRNRQVFASGDELLLAPLSGGPLRRLELEGITLDAATAGGRVLAGTVRMRPGAVEYEAVALQGNSVLWRVNHPKLMAVALSADGLAAAASGQAVAIFDARTGRSLHQVPLTDTRVVDLAFAPRALLVVAQKSEEGDLRVLGIDTRTWHSRWSVALGPTTLPAVEIAGSAIVVSDFRGRTGAVISPLGVVHDRWTDAQGPVYVTGSPQGEIAVAIGRDVAVRTHTGRVRWRGTIPGDVLGLRLDGPWLAAMGTIGQGAKVSHRIWFARTSQSAGPR